MEFVLGGVAAVGAGFFTNPLDVIKTRLQLQGELQSRGLYTVHYRGFFHAFYAVAKADGLLAVQKGLAPALWYQLALNGTRLGMYDFAERRGMTKNRDGQSSAVRRALVAAVAGCAGSYIGSPFYLVNYQKNEVMHTLSVEQMAEAVPHTKPSHALRTCITQTLFNIAELLSPLISYHHESSNNIEENFQMYGSFVFPSDMILHTSE